MICIRQSEDNFCVLNIKYIYGGRFKSLKKLTFLVLNSAYDKVKVNTTFKCSVRGCEQALQLWRASLFACCSRVTSRVSPKQRACSLANSNVTFLWSNCTFFHDLVTSCSVKQITNWLQWIKQHNSGVIFSIQLMKTNSLSCERRNFQMNNRISVWLCSHY